MQVVVKSSLYLAEWQTAFEDELFATIGLQYVAVSATTRA